MSGDARGARLPVNSGRFRVVLGSLLIGGSFLSVYYPVLRSLWGQWVSYEASFGLVIIAISGYMVDQGFKRLRHAKVLARPSPFLGFVVLFAGNLLFLVAFVSATRALQQVALLVALFGLCWLFLGRRSMKELWVPLAYLVFALPLSGELLLRYSSQLQSAAAWIAAKCFSLTGMPVVHRGQILELPHITLEVAPECSGINHIVALMSLAVPLGYLSRASALRKAFVVVFAFFLGIALNGIRVALIGWWSVGHRGLHGPVSTLFISFIFFGGFVILALLTHASFGRRSAAALSAGSGDGRPSLPTAASRVGQPDSGSRVWSSLLAIALLAATWGAQHWYTPRPVVLAASSASFPRSLGSWEANDSPGTPPLFKGYDPDKVIQRTYRSASGSGVTVYVGYFNEQRQGHEVVSYIIDRYHQQAVAVPIAGTMNVNLFSDRSNPRVREMYFWYEINGRAVTNRYHAKLASALSWFLHRRTNAAFVAILPELAEGDAEMTPDQRQFVTEVVPLIRSFLRA